MGKTLHYKTTPSFSVRKYNPFIVSFKIIYVFMIDIIYYSVGA